MSSELRLALVGALVWMACAPPARSAEPLGYGFTPDSTVTYHVLHPLHRIAGVSHQLTGEARLTAGPEPDLVLPLRLSIPLRSFDSGNRNRDRNVLQVLHAARYAEALLEIRSVDWTSRRTEGGRTTAEGTAQGELTLHGATRPVDIRLSGHVEGSRLEVDAAFSFLLSQYAVERPSLLFRPIEDSVRLEIKGIAQRR